MVVEELSDEDQTIAAFTSYAYWAFEQIPTGTTTTTSTTDEESDATRKAMRIRMAMREARRHLVGQNGNYDVAVERFQHTVQWRKVRLFSLYLSFCRIESLTSRYPSWKGIQDRSIEKLFFANNYAELLLTECFYCNDTIVRC
jgi:hypothetical protein